MAQTPQQDSEEQPSEQEKRNDGASSLLAALNSVTPIDDVQSAFEGIRRERSGAKVGGLTKDAGNLMYTRSGATGPVNVTANMKIGMDYFQSQGWSKEASAGIVANGVVESSLNPANVGDSGLAHGVFQWHPDRLRPLEAAYANDPRMGALPDDTALMKNYKMMNYELKYGAEKAHGAILQQQTSAADAGATFSKLVERPLRTDHEMTVRAAKAEGVLAGVNRAETLAGNDKLSDRSELKVWNAKRVANDPVASAIADMPKPAGQKPDEEKLADAGKQKSAVAVPNKAKTALGGLSSFPVPKGPTDMGLLG